MAKYKVLKSVAHNLGHSFLSDMNTGDFKTFVPETIFQLALENHSPRVDIDFINQTVSPKVFDVPDVAKSVECYLKMLHALVEDQGSSWDFVREARLRLEFDLENTTETKCHPRRPKPSLKCLVEIVDDRGVTHQGRPNHWWTD